MEWFVCIVSWFMYRFIHLVLSVMILRQHLKRQGQVEGDYINVCTVLRRNTNSSEMVKDNLSMQEIEA